MVANVPVMPAGQPDAASVTPELNPFAGVTVTVDVPVEPAVAVAAAALSVKLGGRDAAGAKNIALATGPPDPFAVTLIVTLPLMFHTPYTPLLNCEKVRLSSRMPLAESVIEIVCERRDVSQSIR